MARRNRILYGLSLAGLSCLGLADQVVTRLPFLHASAACNGSNPCKVCTNCSRCKFCKTGTCGACAKAAAKAAPTPATKPMTKPAAKPAMKPVRRRQSAAEMRAILKQIDVILNDGGAP